MKTLATSLTLALGLSLYAAAPARSASISSVSASGDNYVYCASGGSTFRGDGCTDSLETVLSGDASNPGGNIELGAHTETIGLTSQGQLSGLLQGHAITLSSLNAADWLSDVDGNGRTLGQDWMGGLLQTYAPQTLSTPDSGSGFINFLLSFFFGNGGAARFSDPNVSYVRQDGDQVKIGLAGHFDARSLLASAGVNLPLPLGVPVQVSEIIKVNYGGETSFHYGFQATASGLVNDQGPGADGRSHNGNYEVSFAAAQPVPEPSLLVGTLLALGVGSALKRGASHDPAA